MSRELFEGAYRKYWDRIECWPNPPQLYSYDLCDIIGTGYWRNPLCHFMIRDELRESINLLNAWSIKLSDLEAWSEVLADYEDDDAWGLRLHFVEPLVHHCMLQPSSTRDRLGRVATNGIHQANLSTVAGYKDALDQDKRKPGRFMRRTEVEIQLERLVKHWIDGNRLLAALQSLDSENYRQQTLDYRNKASHFIAPLLEFGEIQLVTRRIAPFPEMVQQADGSFQLVEDSKKNCVSYGFGGTRPLTLKEIIEANSREYHLAIAALDAYSDLLRDALEVTKDRHLKIDNKQ